MTAVGKHVQLDWVWSQCSPSGRTCTYFVYAELTDRIKIGKTDRDVAIRVAELQTGSPEKLRLLGIVNGDRESEFHLRFFKCRITGTEWFNRSGTLKQFLSDRFGLRHYGSAVRVYLCRKKGHYKQPRWMLKWPERNGKMRSRIIGIIDDILKHLVF